MRDTTAGARRSRFFCVYEGGNQWRRNPLMAARAVKGRRAAVSRIHSRVVPPSRVGHPANRDDDTNSVGANRDSPLHCSYHRPGWRGGLREMGAPLVNGFLTLPPFDPLPPLPPLEGFFAIGCLLHTHKKTASDVRPQLCLAC